MKHLYLFSFFFLAIINGFSQNMSWVRSVGGFGQDVGWAVAVDGSGNVYTVGQFVGTVDFDPGPGTSTLASTGTSDVYVLKLDALGNFVWAVRFGGAGQDFGNGIGLDATGNVYITGVFPGVVDFDPGPGTFTLASNGNDDIYSLKLDPAGNFVWAVSLGGSSIDQSNALAVDASGNVYLTGYFGATVDFDPGPGTYTMTAASFDIFVLKLNSAGNFVWAVAMGGAAAEVGFAIVTDAAGNVYTGGSFNSSTADFDPGPVVYNLSSASNQGNGFISKLDASGNFVWAKAFTGVGICQVFGLALDPGGDVIACGGFKAIIDFDPGSGVSQLMSANNPASYDSFVARLTASGTYVWARGSNNPSDDVAFSTVVDASGNAHTVGQFNGTADFNQGLATCSLTAAGSDMFLWELNNAGSFVNAFGAGSTGADYGNFIVMDASGNFYVAGTNAGPVLFSPGYTIGWAGSTDAFTIKFRACDNLISSQPQNQLVGISDPATFIVGPPLQGASYQWLELNGTTIVAISNGPFYSGANTPTLVVTAMLSEDNYLYRCLVSSGSCTMASTTATLNVYNNTAIHELQQNSWKIYPNPAGDVVYLQASQPLINQDYTIFDQSGRTVLHGKTDAQMAVPIHQLAPGLYFLSLQSFSQKPVKLVKE